MHVPRLSGLRLAALAALLPLATGAFAQKIEQQMSYEQFKAAGLDKLSPQELVNLNLWMEGKLQVETAKAAQTAKQTVTEDKRGLFSAESREPVVTTITGFNGFGKGRSYTLDNGQVWQQTDDTQLTGFKAGSNPQVKITPSLVGTAWYLSIEGFNTRAKVQRVK